MVNRRLERGTSHDLFFELELFLVDERGQPAVYPNRVVTRDTFFPKQSDYGLLRPGEAVEVEGQLNRMEFMVSPGVYYLSALFLDMAEGVAVPVAGVPLVRGPVTSNKTAIVVE